MEVSVPCEPDLAFSADPWSPGVWDAAATIQIDHFHPRSSDHHPAVTCRLLHDDQTLHVAFRVQDRYVRCIRDTYQSLVSLDSCVEFFVEPVPGKGYFNFEINCGGTMLLYYIEDPSPAPDAFFRVFQPVPIEIGGLVKIAASLPRRVEAEITEAVTWTVHCAVPTAVFEPFLGPVGPLRGQTWRGNFFKCADETSHPHWASWVPIGERLRFHQPDRFAPIHLT